MALNLSLNVRERVACPPYTLHVLSIYVEAQPTFASPSSSRRPRLSGSTAAQRRSPIRSQRSPVNCCTGSEEELNFLAAQSLSQGMQTVESICLKYRGHEKIVRRGASPFMIVADRRTRRPDSPLLAAAPRVASRLLPRACRRCQHRRCCRGAQRNDGHGALPPPCGGEVRVAIAWASGCLQRTPPPSTRSADPVWVGETERSAAFKQSHIDKELALLSNSNMRDSVRVCGPSVERARAAAAVHTTLPLVPAANVHRPGRVPR